MPESTLPRFTRDEQVFAVWLSHTVIPVAVSIIAAAGYGGVPPGFLIAEGMIWVLFTVLQPRFEAPALVLLRRINREAYVLDVEALRHRALPAAFATAFVLQFVALSFLLKDTGGPITSPFGAFVIAYAVFSSLLTTKGWSLAIALLGPTAYYWGMVARYGLGNPSDRPSEDVYLAVTLLIIWLTVWLAYLSRVSTLRAQSSIDAETDLATLRAAIDTQIWNRPAVLTRTLPVRRTVAAATLAEYRSDHPELALRMGDSGKLEWIDQARMARAQALNAEFVPDEAAQLFSSCLGLDKVRALSRDALAQDSVLVGELGQDPVLPEELVVHATSAAPSDRLLKETARLSGQEAPGARLAVMLVADAAEWLSRPTAKSAQRSLATSVVVLDADRLMRLAGAAVPRRSLMTAVREQADLSKANPFRVKGATPPAMFFGRGDEEAAVIALLADNSAALIGGRRTGKTSLLQRIDRTLRNGDWTVMYADLQPVGDWTSFAEQISPEWDVDVSADFRPSVMADIVRQLRKRHGERPLIIMLDEIDQFLKWDQVHLGQHVAEAFFRSCRALSQQGEAQFVLAGERVLAERLSSPDSPHWNFCPPVPVRQLARSDADELLLRPLQHLEVGVDSRQAFLDRAWQSTSGHPHLVQYVGSALVALLNDRDPEDRQMVTVRDLIAITDKAEFRYQYIDTYHGQATPLEKSLCNLAAAGATTVARLHNQLRDRNVPDDPSVVRAGLRMLDLYGILDTSADELVFRAEWMPDALRYTGAAGVLDPAMNA